MNACAPARLLPFLLCGLLAAVAPAALPPGTDFRDVIAEAKRRAAPAVLYVACIQEDNEYGEKRSRQVSGSAFVISSDGEFVTNWHVVDKATSIRCLLSDGRAFTAECLGSDKDMDIALCRLRLADGESVPYALFGDSSALEEGAFAIAIGAPYGLNRTLTFGTLSCVRRYIPQHSEYVLWLQTDAGIGPGNSGGPLVDTAGRVVGLNARGMIFGDQAFTIPSPTVLEVLPALREKGNAGWAWFGFQFQPLRDFDRNMVFEATNGVVVSGTDLGSPARKAGFKAGDRVVAVDGAPVTALTWEQMPALERLLGRVPEGSNTVFTIVRGPAEIESAFAPRAKGAVEGEEKVLPRWGFTAKEINRFDNPKLAFYAPDGGVFVSATSWDGNAENAGIKENDILREVGGKPVATLEDLSAIYDDAMAHLDERTKIDVVVERRGRRVPLKLNYFEDPEKEIIE